MKHRQGQWDPLEPVMVNGERELPKFAEEYFAAGRRAARKGVAAAKLHEFRLMTKHFRYLLELFEPLYGERLAGRLKELRAVQTVLGDFNDLEATRAMLDGGGGADVEQVLAYIDKERKQKRAEFRAHWTGEFDAEGREAGWLKDLAWMQKSTARRRQRVVR